MLDKDDVEEEVRMRPEGVIMDELASDEALEGATRPVGVAIVVASLNVEEELEDAAGVADAEVGVDEGFEA